MYVQDVLQTLTQFWVSRGCLLWQPYHTEVGAGTSNPATFLRVLGPEPWWVGYIEPSIRPTDGRYGENPNRLQHYYQYQVILKPSPVNVQDLFLQSLEALGLDLTKHDFRFVEDNWQSPSLGAWGLGWEAWLDGMEILQFTYFQECGGIKLDVRACELTYGVERIAMYLQGVESVYDLKWAPSGITYGDIYHTQEVEYCKYNFEAADTKRLFDAFDMWAAEAQGLLDKGLMLPAYDHCLRLSHLFNVLDARGALSVSERGRFLLRCRAVAEQCAKGYLAQREQMGFPLRRYPGVAPATGVREGCECVGSAKGARTPASPAQTPGLRVPQPETRNPKPETRTFRDRDTLLLEIGVEELPHGDIVTVKRSLPALLEKLVGEWGIERGPITYWVTPRRIAIQVEDLPARQKEAVKEVRGPKKSAALDANGQWTMPARKFAEANGATTDAIYFQEQNKTEYCFVKTVQKGKELGQLLSEMLPRLLRGIPFGKTMGWEDTTVTFSRPVRWLLALHGANVVPVSWQLCEASEIGPERRLDSDRVTYGHRRLGPGAITVAHAASYRDAVREGFVLVDADERMKALRDGVEALCAQHGLVAEDDADLFDEINDLCEWPEPILCAIPKEALTLPEEIIITPMKVQQRYIPLRTKDGKLSGHFIAVANGRHSQEGLDLIRVGNERVLSARLRDAKYFWDTDTKTGLSQFATRLDRVLFHQALGSVADKIGRLRTLYAALKRQLPAVDEAKMAQALTLIKADLTTQMVFEFDSLEGVVGMLYARNEGLDSEVAQAIFEHRLPRRAGDRLPSGTLGLVAGILDRFDTLAGYFGIGIRVKGTSDPFGLRRNALALLAVVRARELDVDLESCAHAALDNFGSLVSDKQKTLADLLGFFNDRLDVMSRDEGYPYDQVAAALASHGRRPAQFHRCLEALRGTDSARLQDLAEQAKRMLRISTEPAASVEPGLLAENESALFALCGDAATAVARLVEQQDFPGAIREVIAWVPVINTYFEAVLVNDKDDRIRRNRHALVNQVLAGMRRVADFTKIEKT